LRVPGPTDTRRSTLVVKAGRILGPPRGRGEIMRLVIALLLVPALALAAEESSSATSGDPMAQWVPPKVKNEAKDKQEIQGLFKAMEAASRTGDLDAAVALIDFPVTMITDDSKGEAKGEAWDREQWTQMMKPMYAKPMKDMKVTHKPTIFLLSDSLATVTDVSTMSHGGKSITARSAMTLVRKDGKWRVKTMAEGGWGDMQPPATASEGQGTTSSGSTGGVAEPPASKQGERDVQAPKQPEPSERTTK
jgi:uncharacterized protein (TIGR02246 family)